jgi:ribosomal protein S18 acetylase RimI-like enzyme
MIYFSDDIKNQIIDTSPIDQIIDKLDEFKNDNEMILTYFNYGTVSIDYIENLLKVDTNKLAYYCTDDTFTISSCISCMVYSRQNKKNSDTILYYIMVISTQKEFRCNGYATKLLNGFVERVKLETKNTNKKVKIILSSLDEVISYYQKYGFEVVDCSFDNYPYFKYFEKYDQNKIYNIMELNITPFNISNADFKI